MGSKLHTLSLAKAKARARQRKKNKEKKKSGGGEDKEFFSLFFTSLPPSSTPPPNSLEPELGAPPVAALGVVPDLVARAEADPLRDRPVLLRDVRELLLEDGGLVGRLLNFFGEKRRSRSRRGERKREGEEQKRERSSLRFQSPAFSAARERFLLEIGQRNGSNESRRASVGDSSEQEGRQQRRGERKSDENESRERRLRAPDRRRASSLNQASREARGSSLMLSQLGSTQERPRRLIERGKRRRSRPRRPGAGEGQKSEGSRSTTAAVVDGLLPSSFSSSPHRLSLCPISLAKERPLDQQHALKGRRKEIESSQRTIVRAFLIGTRKSEVEVVEERSRRARGKKKLLPRPDSTSPLSERLSLSPPPLLGSLRNTKGRDEHAMLQTQMKNSGSCSLSFVFAG